MVLLIACLNNRRACKWRGRLLAKKRIAVRAAIGASGARLVRQLLTENLLVCGFAGLTGLVLGYIEPAAR